MYEVKFSSQAANFIKKLQTDVKERIKDKLKEVSLDPYRYLEHYEGDYHKLRIGDFRALIDVENDQKIMWVRVFDKRGRIYK